MSNTFNVAARCRARRYALQAAYQWAMSLTDYDALLQQYSKEMQHVEVDTDYFQTLITAVVNKHTVLDQSFASYIDRDIKRLSPIECAVLRLATYELRDHLEIPYRVVINEWVELAKQFGATDGHKFVNAVLDKLAKDYRISECQHEKPN